MIKKFSDWIRKTIKYVSEDIWNVPLGDLPKTKSFIIREIRILVLAFKGFTEDKVQLRASALTFNTLLSIVPIAALAFGIAQGFGFDEKLADEIRNSFQGHEKVMEYILELSEGFFDKLEPGLMAIIGLVILIWSVMQVLNHIEKSFNHIWQIKKGRPWGRKFADYLTIMIFAPVFLIFAGSVTVMLTTMVEKVSSNIGIINSVKPAIIFLLRFTPYFIMWLVFTLLYLVMPNTRVKFRSALVAGIIAGTMFQLLQVLYINGQVGVSKYNAIYGSFAAFPLFIIWMQFSWLIVLLGAEISFANQNLKKYEYEYESLNVSSNQRRILMLLILNTIVRKFRNAEIPLSSAELSNHFQIPIRLTREILYGLIDAGILTEVSADYPKERVYQPALDTQKITLHFVLSKLDHVGSGDIPVLINKEYKKIDGIINEFSARIKESDGNVLISEI